MDGFDKWWKKEKGWHSKEMDDSIYDYEPHDIAIGAWQESARQEQKWIAEWLRKRAAQHLSSHAYLLLDAADLIEVGEK